MDRAWAAALHPTVTMATAILLAALTLAPWAGQAAGRSVAGAAAVALSPRLPEEAFQDPQIW